MNYTQSVDAINALSIVENGFSMSPADFRFIPEAHFYKKLYEIIDKYKVGYEIGSESYIKKSKLRFLKTNNISSSFLLDSSRVEYCIPNNKAISPQNGTLLLVKDGGTGGLGEVILYNEEGDFQDYISGGIIELNIKDNNLKHYILGLLKSKHFKEYIDNVTPGGSTIRHSKLLALNYSVPFPEQQEVQELVSLITQNIINKEQQIREKNKKINSLIHEELETHSNIHITYPSSTEINENNFRFDTGLYSNEYKSIKLAIETYEHGYFKLLDRYNAKRGQNLQISNIGLSIYSSEPKSNFYRLVTNVEFTEERTISTFRYLGNKKSLTLIPKNSILLSADGSVGRCIYVNDLGKTITNIHPWVITSKNEIEEQYKSIFTAMFLGYLRTVGFYEKIQDKSNGGGIKLPHLQNWISIPNFPKELQEDIAIEYFNEVEKNQNLSLENYLEKEKQRNSELGIWQLNMEVFSLKEQLEKIISNIVYAEEIEISEYL